MYHQNVVGHGVDHASKKKARLGVWFFFIYLFFYGGFVVVGVLNYETLAQEISGNLNLALFYGIGLIAFAVVLGVVYNYLCSRYEDELNMEEPTP